MPLMLVESITVFHRPKWGNSSRRARIVCADETYGGEIADQAIGRGSI